MNIFTFQVSLSVMKLKVKFRFIFSSSLSLTHCLKLVHVYMYQDLTLISVNMLFMAHLFLLFLAMRKRTHVENPFSFYQLAMKLKDIPNLWTFANIFPLYEDIKYKLCLFCVKIFTNLKVIFMTSRYSLYG